MHPAPKRLPAVAMDGIQYLVRMLSDQQLHCVLRFDGALDAQRLARAVKATFDAEPVLGCRLVEGPWWPHWEPVGGLELPELCPVVSVADPDAAARDLLTEPMQWEQGPQVRVRLLRAGGDTLCLSLSHAIADGGGLLEYVMLLAAAYRAQEPVSAAGPAPAAPARAVHPARGMGQVLRRIPWPARLWSLRNGLMPPPAWHMPAATQASHPAAAAPSSPNGDAGERRLIVRRLSAPAMAVLRACAHARGLSFNGLLLAAFFRALCAVCDPPANAPLPVQMPFNLRRYLPGGRAGGVANLSGSSFPTLVYRPGESFEATLSQAQRALARANEGLPGVGQTVLLHAAGALPWCIVKPYSERVMGRVQRTGFLPILSNMGILEPAQVEFGGPPLAGAYGVGPVIYPPGMLVAASTFGGVLTLAAACTAAGLPVIEACVERTIEELDAASRSQEP